MVQVGMRALSLFRVVRDDYMRGIHRFATGRERKQKEAKRHPGCEHPDAEKNLGPAGPGAELLRVHCGSHAPHSVWNDPKPARAKPVAVRKGAPQAASTSRHGSGSSMLAIP